MSWNITGVGSRVAVKKAVDDGFESLIQYAPKEQKPEYVGAHKALSALVESIPETVKLLWIESWGSVSQDGYFNCKIEMKSFTPTLAEPASPNLNE